MNESLRIIRAGPGKYRIEVYGEDHTLGNLIVRKLLSEDKVKFAYYEVPHPLESKLIIYVDLENGEVDPREIVAKAAEEALGELARFKIELEKALAEGGSREEGS